MKKQDLQPTDDNIRSTFYEDSIGRNKELVNFIRIIDSINESYSIALDSYWGSGKTFFVKQVKMILDAKTEESYGEVEGKKQVVDTWNKISNNMQLKKHVPIYYDAWQNDCDDDPIYSLVYQIALDTANIKGLNDKISFSDIIAAAGKLTGAITGFDPNEIAASLKKTDFLEKMRSRKKIESRVKLFLNRLLPDDCDRLLIIIDELDRCNPEFAVKLLERIKHYFNNDRITFVFAVNLAELQHTVKNHYGTDFNASRYLDRFFDLPVKLPPVDIDSYLESQGLYERNYVFDASMKAVIKKYNLQLREISRYISVSKYIVANEAYSDSFTIRNARNVIIHVIVPIVSALIITENQQYLEFVNGKDNSPLLDFYSDQSNVENVSHYLNFLLPEKKGNPLVDTSNISIRNQEYLKAQLKNFYNALFNKTGECEVGVCLIDNNERRYFKKIVSLLSDNTIKMIDE